MAFKAKHPRNIPAGYYKPIGQLIVRWGFTELYLQSIVWHIWRIRDPKAARLLTWDLNAASKVELFKYSHRSGLLTRSIKQNYLRLLLRQIGCVESEIGSPTGCGATNLGSEIKYDCSKSASKLESSRNPRLLRCKT